jgi:hypothetical protein
MAWYELERIHTLSIRTYVARPDIPLGAIQLSNTLVVPEGGLKFADIHLTHVPSAGASPFQIIFVHVGVDTFAVNAAGGPYEVEEAVWARQKVMLYDTSLESPAMGVANRIACGAVSVV